MIRCSICPENFINGMICQKCASIYCDRHGDLSMCGLCGSMLTQAIIEYEKIDNILIEWLILEKCKRIGLVDFWEIPKILLRLVDLKEPAFLSSHQDIILFPSKKSSNRMAATLRGKFGISEHKMGLERPPEKSRYSVVKNLESGRTFVLLNMRALLESEFDVDFLLQFIPRLLAKIEEISLKKDEIIKLAISETLFAYNKKFEIPFVEYDEGLNVLIQILTDNIKFGYAEFLAFKDVLRQVGPNKAAANFLTKKIGAIFDGIKWDDMSLLGEIYNLFGIFTIASNTVNSVYEWTSLYQHLQASFDKGFSYCKKQLKDFPDLVKAINIFVSRLKPQIYLTYESYQDSVAKALKDALKTIEPRYARLAESLALNRIAEKFLNEIEAGRFPIIQNIGSIDNFMELLSKVFYKNGIYPEVRIIAGVVLHEMQTTLLMLEADRILYQKIVATAWDLSDLIENSMPEIQKIGPVPGYQDQLYATAALNFLSVSQFAEYFFNDRDTANKLVEKAQEMAERHDITSIKLQLKWKKFVSTHDFNQLRAIHRIFSSMDLEKLNDPKSVLKTIGYLTQAIFEEEDREKNLENAEKSAIEFISPEIPLEPQLVYFMQNIRTSSALYHLVRLFKHVLLAEGADFHHNLKVAYTEANALASDISSEDPLNTFTLKTRIVYGLLKGDRLLVDKSYKRLNELVPKGSNAKLFLDIISKWNVISETMSGRRFVVSPDLEFDEDDPWNRLLRSYIVNEMKKDLDENIIKAKAVVFVEGPFDVRVLEKFARKLSLDQVTFMDVGGFTKAPFYTESRFSKLLRILTFVLFDGDTEKEKKKLRIKEMLKQEINLPKENVITLNRNSIEDYILVPHAIKRAFPTIPLSEIEIQKFFEENKTKRNKKNVLDALFKRAGLGKYNAEKAAAIASAMTVSEIDPEIKSLLNDLLRIRGVN